MKTLFVVAIVLAVGFFSGFIVATRTEDKTADGVFPVENMEQSAPLDKINPEIDTVTTSVPLNRVLTLNNKGLTKVPQSVFELTLIEELDLSNNNLSGSLQAEIRHLSKLKVLDLSNNAFTGVPAEVGHLHELQLLNLSNNKLTGLPLEIGNLKNLQVLDVSGNEYSKEDLAKIKAMLPENVLIKTK